jgi:hypothetical protein
MKRILTLALTLAMPGASWAGQQHAHGAGAPAPKPEAAEAHRCDTAKLKKAVVDDLSTEAIKEFLGSDGRIKVPPANKGIKDLGDAAQGGNPLCSNEIWSYVHFSGVGFDKLMAKGWKDQARGLLFLDEMFFELDKQGAKVNAASNKVAKAAEDLKIASFKESAGPRGALKLMDGAAKPLASDNGLSLTDNVAAMKQLTAVGGKPGAAVKDLGKEIVALQRLIAQLNAKYASRVSDFNDREALVMKASPIDGGLEAETAADSWQGMKLVLDGVAGASGNDSKAWLSRFDWSFRDQVRASWTQAAALAAHVNAELAKQNKKLEILDEQVNRAADEERGKKQAARKQYIDGVVAGYQSRVNGATNDEIFEKQKVRKGQLTTESEKAINQMRGSMSNARVMTDGDGRQVLVVNGRVVKELEIPDVPAEELKSKAGSAGAAIADEILAGDEVGAVVKGLQYATAPDPQDEKRRQEEAAKNGGKDGGSTGGGAGGGDVVKQINDQNCESMSDIGKSQADRYRDHKMKELLEKSSADNATRQRVQGEYEATKKKSNSNFDAEKKEIESGVFNPKFGTGKEGQARAIKDAERRRDQAIAAARERAIAQLGEVKDVGDEKTAGTEKGDLANQGAAVQKDLDHWANQTVISKAGSIQGMYKARVGADGTKMGLREQLGKATGFIVGEHDYLADKDIDAYFDKYFSANNMDNITACREKLKKEKSGGTYAQGYSDFDADDVNSKCGLLSGAVVKPNLIEFFKKEVTGSLAGDGPAVKDVDTAAAKKKGVNLD